MGGATLDEPVQDGQQMKSNGSAMLIAADTREEAMKLVESDVYTKHGVWDLSKVGVASRTRHEEREIALADERVL